MKQELKDLVKLPFKIEQSNELMFISDEIGRLLLTQDSAHRFSDCNAKCKDEDCSRRIFIDWAAEALNEKAEREWGEPLRWEMIRHHSGGTNYDLVRCRKCLITTYHNSNDKYDFCPHCGRKLAEPENDGLH